MAQTSEGLFFNLRTREKEHSKNSSRYARPSCISSGKKTGLGARAARVSLLRGVPIAFACKREATPIKRNLLTPLALLAW